MCGKDQPPDDGNSSLYDWREHFAIKCKNVSGLFGLSDTNLVVTVNIKFENIRSNVDPTCKNLRHSYLQ